MTPTRLLLSRTASLFACLALHCALALSTRAQAPAVVIAPASLTEIAGNHVLLSVTATGTAPLGYQWNFSGRPLPGATHSTLGLTRVSSAHAGNYTVTVTNAAGSVTSPAATLTVLASPPAPTALVDPTFTPPSNFGAVLSLPDGRILVGGGTYLLSRINPDGSLDSTLAPVPLPTDLPGLVVHSLLLQPDGKILLAGSTSSSSATDPLAPRQSFLARFRADGTRDPSLVAASNLPAFLGAQLTLQPDGKILVANGAPRLTRLNADGSLDENFVSADLTGYWKDQFGNTRGNASLTLAALDLSGKIIVAASPAFFFGSDPLPAVTIARLTATGALDSTFVPTLTGLAHPRMLSVDPTGRILLVSEIVSGNTGGWRLDRLNPDGTPDASFAPSTGSFIKAGTVRAAVDSLGRIVVAPEQYNGLRWIAPRRFLADGSLDPTLVYRGPVLDGFFRGESPTAVISLPQGQTLIATATTLTRLVAANVGPTNPPRLFPSAPVDPVTVAGGETISIPVTIAGTGPFTYTWSGPPTDTTRTHLLPAQLLADGPLVLESARFSGTYVATIRNPAGTTTTAPLTVTVTPRAPAITAFPVAALARAGRTVTLSATVLGSGPLSVQWLRNGQPVSAPQLAPPGPVTLDVLGDAAQLGTYRLIATNALGSLTSNPVEVTLDPSSLLANVSTRGLVGTGERTLIAGFMIGGTTPKSVLLRAVGPRLAAFGVTGFVLDPNLTVYNAAGQIIATNDNVTETVANSSYTTSPFGLISADLGGLDAAVSLRLPPGSYTLQVGSADNTAGIALAEVYESATDSGFLTNVSTRAYVGTGAEVAIPGVIVSGATPKRLLFRAVGPTLTQFGLTGVLADPVITLIDGANRIVSANDNWESNPDHSALRAAATAVGAFPLPAGSRDAALLLTLAPGSYTALVSGVNNTTGVALVEVYEVP